MTKDIHSSGIFSLPPELRWDPPVQGFNAAKNKELNTTRAAVRTLPSAKALWRTHPLARTCGRQRVFLR